MLSKIIFMEHQMLNRALLSNVFPVVIIPYLCQYEVNFSSIFHRVCTPFDMFPFYLHWSSYSRGIYILEFLSEVNLDLGFVNCSENFVKFHSKCISCDHPVLRFLLVCHFKMNLMGFEPDENPTGLNFCINQKILAK